MTGNEIDAVQELDWLKGLQKKEELALQNAKNATVPNEETRYLDEAKKFFKKGPGFSSVYGSSQIGDNFNVKYGVYPKSEFSDKYLDPSLTNSLK